MEGKETMSKSQIAVDVETHARNHAEVARAERAARVPLVLHIPHASLVIPDDALSDYVVSRAMLDEHLARSTDHFTDELFTNVSPSTTRATRASMVPKSAAAARGVKEEKITEASRRAQIGRIWVNRGGRGFWDLSIMGS